MTILNVEASWFSRVTNAFGVSLADPYPPLQIQILAFDVSDYSAFCSNTATAICRVHPNIAYDFSGACVPASFYMMSDIVRRPVLQRVASNARKAIQNRVFHVYD